MLSGTVATHKNRLGVNSQRDDIIKEVNDIFFPPFRRFFYPLLSDGCFFSVCEAAIRNLPMNETGELRAF